MLNKLTIFVTIIAIILIIGVPTYYKVNSRYESRVELTMKNKIKVKAIQCWNDSKCPNDTVYLSDLYKTGYLDKVINPVTKKAINDYSYVKKENGKLIIKVFE